MINKFIKKKKIIALILLFLTIFSIMQPVLAAAGTGKFVGGQFASQMRTTDNNKPDGILLRRLTNQTTGKTYTVFCTDHGTEFITGTTYNGQYYTPTNEQMKKAAKVAYLGWYKERGDYVVNGGISDEWALPIKKAYVYTQQYLWEVLDQSHATFLDAGYQNEYVEFKNNIENEINNMKKRPSFDGTEIEVNVGETTILTDSNGVLQNYNSINQTKDGVNFEHTLGENTLKITVTENCNVEKLYLTDATMKNWGMIKNGTEDHDTTMYFTFNNATVQNQLYSLNYNDPVTLSFDLNINLFGRLELSKLNSNGDLVDGAVFNVTGDNGFNQNVTVSNGRITLEKLKKGNYFVKEISSPEGYLLNTETYQVTVKSNETATQAIVNNEPFGEIKLTKIDSVTGNNNRIDGEYHHGDASIEGSVYTLYAKEDIYNVAKTIKYLSKDEAIATFSFNKNGVASVKIINNQTTAPISIDGDLLKGLPIGNYYSKETTVPLGYKLDKNIYDYVVSYKDDKTDVIQVGGTVVNDVIKAPFEVIKISTNTSTTAETIANAEFTAILTKYVDYYGSFEEALKHLDEYANDEYSIFRTDSTGHGVSGRLAFGNYTVNETFVPNSKIEKVEEFYVTIDRDSNTPIKELVANDGPFESFVKLQKQDKETGKTVTYSSATFALYKQNENTNEWERVKCKVGDKYIDSWKTNNEGVAKTETKLAAGKYKVEELQVPTGFIEFDGELTFEISRKNPTLDYDKDLDAWITVTVKNEQPKANLIIDKTIALREGVDTSLVDVSDLSGIKFKLTAKENILDYADGSVIYKAGEEIDQYNLDKQGNLKISNLHLGKYQLQEIETLPGLVLDNTIYDVNIEQKDTTTKLYTVNKEIVNDTTAVEFSKTDITGDKELPGAKLTVLNENGKVIDSWTSTDKTHIIEGMEANKNFVLREEISPDSYVKSTDVKFRVDNNNKIQKVQMIDKQVVMSKVDVGGQEVEGAELKVVDEQGNIVDSWTSGKETHAIKNLEENKRYFLYEDYAPQGFVISNCVEFFVSTDKETQLVKMVDKQLMALKTDVDGNSIEGATLTVTSTKTKNIVDKWISGKTPHAVSGLIENETYLLKEEMVIDGFVKATDIEFTVTSDKETQEIVMVDKVVSVSKTDLVTGEELPGAELEITDKDGNIVDKWTSTTEPHIVKGLEEGKEYKLTETTCPYGFEQAESITFTVTEEKENQLIEMKDMPILKTIKVVKIDADTKEKINSEFTFGLYEDFECTKLIKEVQSNVEDGTVTFDNLRYGVFFIKEIKAPENYQLSDKIVLLEISDDGVFADDLLLEDKDSVCTFEFENKQIPEIQTGNETNYPMIIMSIVLSILCMIICFVILAKKNRK